jgi:FkbM family methyltransferase
MLYSLNDRYLGEALHHYGEYGELELELLAQTLRPGDVVVEAGANIGTLTIPIARAIGHGTVYAFEPQRLTFQILSANVALNGLDNVHTRHAALGRTTGEIAVPVLDPLVSQNFGGLSLVGSSQGEPVPVQTIDGLGLKTCRLIKVDVQGMEIDVIKGAAETIKRCRPILYVENEQPEIAAELVGLIQGFGYETWEHFPRLYNPNNHFGVTDNLWPGIESINMFCLPAEMKATVQARKVATPADWRGQRNAQGFVPERVSAPAMVKKSAPEPRLVRKSDALSPERTDK